MTVAQIAAETAFSTDSVLSYLRRAGIPIRRTRYHIDPERLVKLRQLGLSTKQLAEEFGCSIATVERAFRRYGIFAPSQPTIIDRIDPKKLAKLRKEGGKVVEIARRLNCSERTVGRAFRRYGISR
jgi:AraC-like DNA-binding protein